MQQVVKEIRNIKNELTDHIFTYAEHNNLGNAVIQISDGKLKFQNIKSTSPLSYGFLEQCLLECINDENQVKELIKYIKSKRTHKISYDIRRTYRKDI